MDRRRFLLTSAAGALASPLAAEAQQPGAHRVGILTDVEAADDELRQALSSLGYVQGRNLVVETRYTEGKPNRAEEAAVELVRLKVDVIVATYPGVVMSARRASTTVPIVMVNTPDPVELGLVASLAHPGGNITGVTSLSTDLSTKQLELLKQALPGVSRVAVLRNPDNPWHRFAVKGLRGQEQSLRVQLQVLGVRGPSDFDEAFRAMNVNRAQALLVFADPVTVVHRKRLADLTIKHRLPAMVSLRGGVETGNLMSYWADGQELIRRAVSYVDRILKGAKPADLPIEQPTKYELVINLKTAKALGLTIPPSLLARADQVIE
jgi:putative ABC transport system substrate-binding protein